ncbi:putative SOS response-associated peptidase YedK [compost metagenome]
MSWKLSRTVLRGGVGGNPGFPLDKVSPDNPKLKQPYFIHLQGDQPLFFAALGHFPRGGAEEREGDGFVILTGAADAGLTEVHDRKPLVLLPEQARAWVDPATSPQEAEDIARYHVAMANAFEWFPVSRDVGNVRNDYPGLIQPI